MTNEQRRNLMARRDEVKRHLADLTRGLHRRGSSPARRHTSKKMLCYLLADIERELAGLEKGPK